MPSESMGDMAGITLQEAHNEALELIGEQQVVIRVLSKRLRVAMQMLNAQQPGAVPAAPTPPVAPPATPPNRAARRGNGAAKRATGKRG